MRQENNDERDSEFQDKVVAIKRVVKVVKGGRNMRFSALVVVGDGKGRVGVGLGKAAEIPEAIRKGREAAQKSMVTVVMDENASRNIRTKSLGSNNKQNVVLATLDAFEHLKSPEEVARLRGKTVDEIRA